MDEVKNLLKKYFKEGELEEIIKKESVNNIIKSCLLEEDQEVLKGKNIFIQKYLCCECGLERYVWYGNTITEDEIKKLILKDHNKHSLDCNVPVNSFILYDKREMKL